MKERDQAPPELENGDDDEQPGEAGVLGVSAMLPAPQQVAAVTRGLKAAPATALPSLKNLSRAATPCADLLT